MIEYFVGNAVFENKDEGPAIISFDGKEYQLHGCGNAISSIADVITFERIKYKNLPKEINVKKFKPADITPLNNQEVKLLKTAIKQARQVNAESLEGKLSTSASPN